MGMDLALDPLKLSLALPVCGYGSNGEKPEGGLQVLVNLSFCQQSFLGTFF